MLKLHFRRPFVYVPPNNVGLLVNAVVILAKKGYEIRTERHTNPDGESGYTTEKIRYQYRLMIDLWLVQFVFGWKGWKWHAQ